MSTAAIRILKSDKSILSVQMDMCPSVTGKQRAYVEKYLYMEGITDLSMVTEDVKIRYRIHVANDLTISAGQKRAYRNAIDPFIMYYLMPQYPVIAKEIIQNESLDRCPRNKIGTFLMENEIQRLCDITCDIRNRFKESLDRSISSSKADEYLKLWDRIKLESIRQENQKAPFLHPKLKYDGTPLFLGYHPDYDIASSLYYCQKKDILIYDFSDAASEEICKQIVDFLNWIFQKTTDTKIRHDQYLAPLHKFFRYCMEHGIKDIELMESADVDGYRNSIKGTVGTKDIEYFQIVNTVQRFLFCNNAKVRWEANNWFLERFVLKSGRTNPARPVIRLSFFEIENSENRQLLKGYISYLLGLTDKSVSSIRHMHYRLLEFLKFCDLEGITFSDMNKGSLDRYADHISRKDNKERTFNQKIIAIFRFWNYWAIKGKVQKPVITAAIYLKNEYNAHNDLSVSADSIEKVIMALKKAPKMIRYMYLVLFGTGCRISEICTLRANAFYMIEDTAYLRAYQSKMKRDKGIPIPERLYYEMTAYIAELGKSGEEYIFTAKGDRPYSSDYFRKKVKEMLINAGIDKEEYNFRPHGYRHTLATRLYDAGISIQIVREYLDHNSSEMTKQYIDYNGRRCRKASEEYFNEHKYRWGNGK